MDQEALLQLLSDPIDFAPAVGCSYHVSCAAVVSCSYQKAVQQLLAVLSRVWAICSCQQFMP
jgi:hypothetical protein